MPKDHQKLAIEIYTGQYEFFAEKTAIALQFPLNLIMTLNASAVAASLLLVRGALGNEHAKIIIEAVQSAFWVFGGGIVCVLIASWFQWKLYSKMMHRKRQLLESAIDATDFKTAILPFINEPTPKTKTYFQGWCFFFIFVSFICFLIGVYLIGDGFK
ncbi:hypothetical protein Pan241w_28370 [Gimesia alba]|uniref:Uncharacterized protein n=1 Tax=Gimesia alba TaxID=2527973 RepID=A0A517RFU5_9PLAN|nr:hypothetical protein [Gimesia alba]QDT42748.1 hypothetical protein Pan241w_28370 [Gimesia alba]